MVPVKRHASIFEGGSNMKTSRKQTQLTKAARFVIRSLSNGRPHVVSTISRAVRRYRVKQHDLWVRVQATGN